jgi:hypothetical protein
MAFLNRSLAHPPTSAKEAERSPSWVLGRRRRRIGGHAPKVPTGGGAKTANVAAARALQEDTTCEVMLLGKGPGGPKSVVYCYDGGIVDFVKHINKHKEAIHPRVIRFDGQGEMVEQHDGRDVIKRHSVEVAMQWNAGYNDNVFSFANNINTHEGGAHLSGFKGALTGTLNKYARDKGLLKEKEDNLEGEDVREGLAAVISVKLRDPQFEGQTKTKLGTEVADCRLHRRRGTGRLPGGPPDRSEENPGEVRPIRARAGGGTEGPRSGQTQEHPGWERPARKAGGLLGGGPRGQRAVHRRGRLGRRQREAGSGSAVPGDPADQWENTER